jgi:predicted O-methyltransferase YrrM
MKNCILITVHTLDKSLVLLLESILIYGNISKDTVIVVHTSRENIDILKDSHLCIDNKVLFELISSSAFFTRYQKILFIDPCIIVKADLSKLFDECVDDLLYVYDKGIAFSSHAYMCHTSDLMLFLINKITKEDSYTSYNIFPDKLYNKKVITQHTLLVLNENMESFLSIIKDNTIMENINKTKDFINNHLLSIIKESGELLEGNIFMMHLTTEYNDAYLNKAKNICNVVLNKEIRKCMEIGFNSGFSALLMLISNPNIHVDCFDLGEHKYTMPCYNKIKEVFGDRINITIGDSGKTLTLINEKYQLIHIDGGHDTQVANNDIMNSIRMSSPKTILIMDDYDAPHLKQLWDTYVSYYNFKPLHINLYRAPEHDIKYV